MPDFPFSDRGTGGNACEVCEEKVNNNCCKTDFRREEKRNNFFYWLIHVAGLKIKKIVRSPFGD